MRTVLPGRPAPKLQAVSTALWEGIRVIVSDTTSLEIIRNTSSIRCLLELGVDWLG